MVIFSLYHLSLLEGGSREIPKCNTMASTPHPIMGVMQQDQAHIRVSEIRVLGFKVMSKAEQDSM